MYYSDVESKRFGMRVFRDVVEDINTHELLHEIKEKDVDLLIFRVPVEKQYNLDKLNEVGLPYIVADTLVYYYADLHVFEPKSLRNHDIEFIECTCGHNDIINELVQDIFTGYKNHYYANPYIPKAAIVEGYKEWARDFLIGRNTGKISWLAKRDDQHIGFAICSYEKDDCEGVLYGVKKSASSGGVYGDFIRFTQRYFKKKGMKRMKVSTQVQNYAVQKVWARESMCIAKAYLTIHINAFLLDK